MQVDSRGPRAALHCGGSESTTGPRNANGPPILERAAARTGGRRPALARCLQPQPPRDAPAIAGDDAWKQSGIGRRVQPTNPHRTCQVQIVFLTSSSSQPSSSCPSSFHPSSWPWNNHLLDLLDTLWRIIRTPPGRSRRPRSMRSALRRHGAPECSMTPCNPDEAACVPSSDEWKRSVRYLAAKKWFVDANESDRHARAVWRTLWRRGLTVKFVGTWAGPDQHLAVKTWVARSCPLPCDVRKLDGPRPLRFAGAAASRSSPGARCRGFARRGSCSRP